MKPRDLALVAAVVLLGGFALADTLRGRGDETSAQETETVDETGPAPRPDAPADWPAGRLRGTLVFTDAEDCRIRVIGLGGGRERPAGDLVGFCRLWAAPIGQRIAYDTGGVRGSAGDSFAVVDLRRAGVELASIQDMDPASDVLWSPDAQRVAWCAQNVGQELELGTERPRSLTRCPIAYTPEGQLAFAAGRRLVVGDRTILVERRAIIQANWGADGSLLVQVGEGRIRRYDELMRVTHDVDLSTGFRKLFPSPDNCAVAFFDAGRMRFEDVGCYAGPPSGAYIGLDAAWSPDGNWLAVADLNEIVFQQLVGGDERIVWPARASELYWRGD